MNEPPKTAPDPPRWSPWDGAALLGLLLAWAFVHEGQLSRGFTSDEVSLLLPGTWAQLVADVQTAAN